MSGQLSDSTKLSRRTLLRSASVLALATLAPTAASAQQSPLAEPIPLSAVRLKPSIFLDAVNADRAYLMSLEPDRLVHNFRKGAGLAPKGEL